MKDIKDRVALILVLFFVFSVKGYAQNTISGHVFDTNRTPLQDVYVDLLDEFSRTINRVRTSSSGRYFFRGMPAGTYLIRVLPYGTNLREEEKSLTIQNIIRRSGGRLVVGAFMNANYDFYLRINRKKQPVRTEIIFAQQVPRKARDLYKEAMGLLGKKQKKEGYKKLIAAIEMFPDYYMAIERLGLEYVNDKHYKVGSIILQRAVRINPKSYKGWYGIAFAFSSLNLNSQALKASKKAVKLNPGSTDALFLAGKLFRISGNYKKSEKYLIKAKKIAKQPYPEVHWQLALLYGKNLNRYEDAAEELELFLKHQPDAKDAIKIKKLIRVFREKAKKTK